MQQFIKENLIYWMDLLHWKKFVLNRKKVGRFFYWVLSHLETYGIIYYSHECVLDRSENLSFDSTWYFLSDKWNFILICFFSSGAPCTALREVSLLKGLKHTNIVSLHDIIFNQTTLTLVFEYVEKDLKQYMDDCGNILHIKNVRLFLFQLLRGLDYCHSRKILHRDLK